MGNQCSGPKRADPRKPSSAHISLAALNTMALVGLASSLILGHFSYLTPATLPLQARPAEQDALRFPLLWTHLRLTMTRDGKKKTLIFPAGLIE